MELNVISYLLNIFYPQIKYNLLSVRSLNKIFYLFFSEILHFVFSYKFFLLFYTYFHSETEYSPYLFLFSKKTTKLVIS